MQSEKKRIRWFFFYTNFASFDRLLATQCSKAWWAILIDMLLFTQLLHKVCTNSAPIVTMIPMHWCSANICTLIVIRFDDICFNHVTAQTSVFLVACVHAHAFSAKNELRWDYDFGATSNGRIWHSNSLVVKTLAYNECCAITGF